MKLKTIFCLSVAIFVFCFFSGKTVLASGNDYVAQTNYTSNMQWGISRDSVTPNIVNVAQSFKTISSIDINSISVILKRYNFGFYDNVFVTIRSDNNNNHPGDTVLATSNLVDSSNVVSLFDSGVLNYGEAGNVILSQ
jgi:hypothetical protein